MSDARATEAQHTAIKSHKHDLPNPKLLQENTSAHVKNQWEKAEEMTSLQKEVDGNKSAEMEEIIFPRKSIRIDYPIPVCSVL